MEAINTLEKHLPFVQKETDKNKIHSIIHNESLTKFDKIKQLFVFVTPHIKDGKELMMMITEPVSIKRYERETGILWNRSLKKGYAVNSYGFIFENNRAKPDSNNEVLDSNIDIILNKLTDTKTPFRTDRNKAIIEANDINYLIKQASKDINSTNIHFEIWSVYDVLTYMGQISP